MSLFTDIKYLRLLSHNFRNFKQKKENLWNFSCPICGDSKKNKLKARGYVYRKTNNLYYICHNCNVGLSLGNLIKQIDAGMYRQYALERFKNGENGRSNYEKPTFNIPTPKFDKLEEKVNWINAERLDTLPEGHFCLEYIKGRKIPKESYKKLFFTSNYKKLIDELKPEYDKKIDEDARLVIPYFDEYNNLIAVAGRALTTADEKLRYVKVKIKDDVNRLIYGLNTLDKSKTVRVVEGEMDSLFVKNCIASGDSALQITAKEAGSDDFVLIYDNEPRNKEIVREMNQAIKNQNKIVIWPSNIQQKDINDMIKAGMTQDDIESVIDNNTFQGLEAQTKFIFWKKL